MKAIPETCRGCGYPWQSCWRLRIAWKLCWRRTFPWLPQHFPNWDEQ